MNRICRILGLAGLLAWTLPGGNEIDRLTDRGSDYFLHGHYSEALDFYQQALQLGGGAFVLANLGRLYEQLGQDDKALDSYQRAAQSASSPQLLTSLGDLYRRMGNSAKALESYRDAAAWEQMGTLQALDLHDPDGALGSFSHLTDAHLLRAEVLYRMGRLDEAANEFRAVGNNWMALYGLGRIEPTHALDLYGKAIAYMAGTPDGTTDLLPRKRAVFDAAIGLQTSASSEILLGLIEGAHGNQDPPALARVQAKLAPGSILIDYWTDGDRLAAVWATHDGAGIATPTNADLLVGVPLNVATNLIIIPDGGLNSIGFEALGSPPLIERHTVSYLPDATLLLREQSAHMPLLPWQRRFARITRKSELPNNAPVLSFRSPAIDDRRNPNRARIAFSDSEALFRAEAQQLSLKKTDLVILADGNQVLADAFLVAGARAVVLPRWPVSATSTADFLQRLEANLAQGMPPAAALRSTKLALLHSGAPAREWAAFILMGDGSKPVRGALSWWWIVAAVCVGVRIGVSIFRLPRRAN